MEGTSLGRGNAGFQYLGSMRGGFDYPPAKEGQDQVSTTPGMHGMCGHFAQHTTTSPGSGQLLPAMEPMLLAAGGEEASNPAVSNLESVAGSSCPEP